MELMRAEFDLDWLRDKVAPLFRQYDEAVRLPDSGRAHAAKMEVTGTALAALKTTLPSPEARGLYLFAGRSERLAELGYVGKSSPGTLFKRIESRLRDETCLDASQYPLSREEVWDRAYARMCVSMGQPRVGRTSVSAPETLIRYAFDHVKTMGLFKNASRILFFTVDAPAAVIKAAESLLIYSAVSGGAPLHNIQERDNLTTDFERGVELAMEVIRQSGIDPDHWTDRASALLGRFRGVCC